MNARLSPFGLRSAHAAAAACLPCQAPAAPQPLPFHAVTGAAPLPSAERATFLSAVAARAAAAAAPAAPLPALPFGPVCDGAATCHESCRDVRRVAHLSGALIWGWYWPGNGATFPRATGAAPRPAPARSAAVAVWRPDVTTARVVIARRAAAAAAARAAAPDRRRVFAVTSSGVTVATYGAAARTTRVGDAAYPVSPTVRTLCDVSEDDVVRLRAAAVRYCRAVDATRSRKRAHESADDVAHDAVLVYARLLSRAADWEVIAYADDVDGASDDWQVGAYSQRQDAWTAEDAARAGLAPVAWQYPRAAADDDVVCLDDDDDDDAPVSRRAVTRATLRRWAVRDAARRNGYRLDAARERCARHADAADGCASCARAQRDDALYSPDAQTMRQADRGVMALTSDTHVATLSTSSAAAWSAVWDPQAFPVCASLLFHAADAEHSGRASGIWGATTRDVTGGTTRNARHTARVRAAAAAEWETLRASVETLRDATTARHVDV